MNPNIDTAVVVRMRQAYRDGKSIADIFREMVSGLSFSPSTLVTVWYFKEAFGLKLRDVLDIQESPLLGGDSIGLEELDAKLRSKMRDISDLG